MCMFGVTAYSPYKCCTRRQKCSNKASARHTSSYERRCLQRIRQARTKCRQHSRCSSVRTSYNAGMEKYMIQFLNWSAAKSEKPTLRRPRIGSPQLWEHPGCLSSSSRSLSFEIDVCAFFVVGIELFLYGNLAGGVFRIFFSSFAELVVTYRVDGPRDVYRSSRTCLTQSSRYGWLQIHRLEPQMVSAAPVVGLQCRQEPNCRPSNNASPLLVVLSKEHYIKEADRQLNESVFNRKLSSDIISQHSTAVKQCVHSVFRRGLIDKRVKDFLVPHHPREARFYLLPEIEQAGKPW